MAIVWHPSILSRGGVDGRARRVYNSRKMIIWPGHMRRRARRQLEALTAWNQGFCKTRDQDRTINRAHKSAKGYFGVRDWVGVEACYHKAKRIIDEQ